jgi:transcriptional regulator with XRE-family HTH domain
MKLGEYIKAKGLSAEGLAGAIGGVSASGVRKWVAGERIPRRDQIEKIAEITGGDVLPNDFFDLHQVVEGANAA